MSLERRGAVVPASAYALRVAECNWVQVSLDFYKCFLITWRINTAHGLSVTLKKKKKKPKLFLFFLLFLREN